MGLRTMLLPGKAGSAGAFRVSPQCSDQLRGRIGAGSGNPGAYNLTALELYSAAAGRVWGDVGEQQIAASRTVMEGWPGGSLGE